MAQPKSKKDAKYDVVLFGATGFTGQYVLKYMMDKYPKSVKWALAGRSKERIQKKIAEMATELGQQATDHQNIDILLADSDNFESLKAVCEQTKAVASAVGPFFTYGL
jgi:short subunit dehydrogenase-like uncharacterized protein